MDMELLLRIFDLCVGLQVITSTVIVTVMSYIFITRV